MLWFAVSRSLAASDDPPAVALPEPVATVLQDLRRLAGAAGVDPPDDAAATVAALEHALARLADLTTTLTALAALKRRFDGE